MSKECSLRIISAPTKENDKRPQVTAAESEKEDLFLSGTKKAAALRSLDRPHHNRDYKVPFVQLLQSPQRDELSLKPSLDSGLQVG